ncbi:MAG: hypothetical protein WA459_03960, partial [Stellaceae bacterium]
MSTISTLKTHGISLGSTYPSPLTITSTGAVEASSGNAIYGSTSQAWTVVNSGLVEATGYLGDGVYLKGAASLVTNSGTIAATQGRGILLADGGTVMNTGMINGSPGVGVYMSLGGYVGNSAGGLIEGGIGVRILGAAGTVTNSATILGKITSIGGPTGVVGLYKGGSVANTGTGLIEGYTGVYIAGAAGTITNSGTIVAAGIGGFGIGVNLGAGGSVGNTGLIEGYDGVAISGSAGTVTNSGTIESASARGVFLGAGGSIDNKAGLIEGNHSGVDVYLGTGTVSNFGTIVATGPSGVGVELGGGGTVIDAGTIIGHTEIGFGGTGNDLLVLEPGYAALSGVYGGEGGGTNTLELGSAAGVGTVSGLGSKFLFFGTVTVDAGARWVLSDSNTIGNGGTLVDAGTISGGGLVVESGGIEFVLSGGAASGTVLSGGTEIVSAGGRASGTIVASGGREYVHGT